MNTKNILGTVLLFFSCGYLSAQIRTINGIFSKPNSEYIEINDYSVITEGEINSDEIILYNLSPEERKNVNLNVPLIEGLDLNFNFLDANNNTVYETQLKNKEIFYNGNSSSVQSFPGGNISLSNCDGKVGVLTDNKYLVTPTLAELNAIDNLSVSIKINEASTNGFNLGFPEVNMPNAACKLELSIHEATDLFVNVFDQPNGTYVEWNKEELGITYVEKYAIVADNETIRYKIFANNHQEQISGDFENKYGVNCQTIDISGLTVGDIYDLELENINKSKKKYLRFKLTH